MSFDPLAPPDRAAQLVTCGLLWTEPRGEILDANEAAQLWLGRSRAQLLGVRFQDLLTMGSRIFHYTHWAPLLQLQGSVREVQLEAQLPDGRALPMLVNVARRTRDGRVAPGPLSRGDDHVQLEIAFIVAADRRSYERELLAAKREAEELLTREREAQRARARVEARLHLALEAAELRRWSYDPSTRQRSYESDVARLLGLPDAAALDAGTFLEAIHPDDRAREAELLDRACEPGSGVRYELEFRLRGVDGLERTVRATGKTFCDAAGTPTEFVGMLEDYTERRATEAALRAAEQEARAQLQFREQLIGIVSHDLRSPIQTIKLGADLLLGSAADAVAQRIARAANRAARLVGELLDFTQVRLGAGMSIERVHCDVGALAEAVADELRLAWPKRAIVQRHEGEHHALVDPDRLSQVITNLATNALVYGDPGAAVTIHSEVGAGALSLSVHNRGPAIPDDVQARMFEPMQRGVEHVSSAVRSVGLGLFIVRAIATAHGGSVTARSTEAEGTTFELSLPSA